MFITNQNDVQVIPWDGSGLDGGLNAILAKRPYISDKGRYRGQPVVAVTNGQKDDKGYLVFSEKPIQTNATLRKDEWLSLEEQIIMAARERLVIVDDLQSNGLTSNVGGLGTMISEWETASEMTDATATMDGETEADRDTQEFGLSGVPIPVIQKPFRVSERMLLASRTRGASLDTTLGEEASRAVARTSEKMVFNGLSLGTVRGYNVYGLTTFPGRSTFTISDWSLGTVTPEDILADILAMVEQLETDERHFGPFTLYIPATFSARFREDFKANSDKTLMQRVTDEQVISDVKTSDVLADGNVILVQLTRDVIDLAVASDVTTVQWASGSGWTNKFQVFAAWAPRLKQDFDGHVGILHGSV